MSIQQRQQVRDNLVVALQEVLPMDSHDNRILVLASAIEDMIDLKVGELTVRPID